MPGISALTLPAGDTHFGSHLRRGPYQLQQRETAIGLCKHSRRTRTAVDVGAHVGTWSQDLERHFDSVHAFEPVYENAVCLAENAKRTTIHVCALGASIGVASMRKVRSGNSGTWTVIGQGDIPMYTLDHFSFHAVDLLKVDTEGYENEVLTGAKDTILRCQPVIVLELRDTATMRACGFPTRYQPEEVIARLRSWGMHCVDRIDADYIFAWSAE